jgi:hypothetical protein
MKKITFEILIHSKDGKGQVSLPWKGYDPGVPGLVIHKQIGLADQPLDNSWKITHLKSGLNIGRTWDKRKDALKVCKLLAPLTDWTQTAEELQKIDGLFRKTDHIFNHWKTMKPEPEPAPEPRIKLSDYGYELY